MTTTRRHGDTVRKTLLLYFGISGVMRLGMVGASGHVPPASLWWSLLAIPVVMGVTVLARRWPPPLGQVAMRRIVFVLLLLSGASLLVPAALRLAGLG